MRYLNFEEGIPYYPFDYVGTKTYNEIEQLNSKYEIIKYYRRPEKLRVNYEKLAFPYPFISNWEEVVSETPYICIDYLHFLNDKTYNLIPVKIIMIDKNIPKKKGLILFNNKIVI